jgi:hypothetical protein
MKRNLAVLASAALLIGAIATGAEARGGFGGGHMGGHMGGGFGEPLIGGQITTSPIYNPSSPYTVTQSPEVGVSPASPGSLFH